MTLRLLDLFCGAGGAAMGYHRAGFEVVGVDIEEQRHYPFAFHQADAFDFLADNDLSGFTAIHASPPCQGYSIMRNLPWLSQKEYPLLILPMREALTAIGLPFVIENVAGARWGAKGLKVRGLEAHGMKAAWLCGGMFGLPFYRHRYFETNWFWMQPGHPKHVHTVRNGRMCGARARDIVHNGARRVAANVGHAAGVGLVREVMGLPWMTREEITQAIPPAYTEYIGRELMKVLA